MQLLIYRELLFYTQLENPYELVFPTLYKIVPHI